MSSQLKTVKLAWVKQGTIAWDDWWVQRHGKTLKQMPGLKDHVSFANYDLQRNSCPTIVFGDTVLEIQGVPDSKLGAVKRIVEYHGFQITSVS